MKRGDIPLIYDGGGKFYAASTYWEQQCDERYIKDTCYFSSIVEERSYAEHARYMSSIQEAFDNLPEGYTFASAQHLRKRGLIECGFFHERIVFADSEQGALAVARFAEEDEYAVVATNATCVIIRTPKSQSFKDMNKSEFEDSVEKVERWAWSLSGLTPEEAAAHVGSHA